MNNFYWENYIYIYPDLKKVPINNLNDAWTHLTNIGINDHKLFSKYLTIDNFDWEYYIDLYNLREFGINNRDDSYYYWLNTGKNLGHTISNLEERQIFDWEKYLDTYKYLKDELLITTEKLAWYHWNNHGKHEAKIFFDQKKQQ